MDEFDELAEWKLRAHGEACLGLFDVLGDDFEHDLMWWFHPVAGGDGSVTV